MRYGISPLIVIAAGVMAFAPANGQARTILAIGAHAGDMELTAGPLLVHQHKRGDRVVILQMTLGEGGNPRLSPTAYGTQKRTEALAADSAIGAETIFAPYKDGEIPDDEAVRRYVADVIRQVKPAYVVTHWRKSIHKDHSITRSRSTSSSGAASLRSATSTITTLSRLCAERSQESSVL